MHAIRQHEFGPPETLVFEETDDPDPGPGQVRIAVKAAGVHLLDTSIRKGSEDLPYSLPELPMIPGRGVAGVVDALGSGVDKYWLGKRVVTHLGWAHGGYAELAVREVESVHELPGDLAYDSAVAMIATGRTAIAVLSVAGLVPGDVVLVTAAAGGLGTLFVQAERNAGGTVVGVAGGPGKVERVRANGADVAVDYTAPGWAGEVREALGDREVTVALDGVGGTLGRGALELLGSGGRFVMFGWSSGEHVEITTSDLYDRGLTASAAIGPRIMKWPGGLRALEEEALGEAAAGRLMPAVQRFPLKDAPAAHIALESRATVGAVVLIP